jgi:hypothetical protein
MEPLMQIFVVSLSVLGGETIDSVSSNSSAAPINSTLCEPCPQCEKCSSCTFPVILAFAITAVVTTLLLTSIYIPILISVFKNHSKVAPRVEVHSKGEEMANKKVDRMKAVGSAKEERVQGENKLCSPLA